MSYIESINESLTRLKSTEAELRRNYDSEVTAANNAFESAQQDQYYDKFKQYCFDMKNQVGDFIKFIKSKILSLPNQYSIREFAGTLDVEGAIAKLGILEYIEKLVSRCNDEMSKIKEQSTPEEDIKVIEKLEEYYCEICVVCNQFDEFYYAHIRTSEMEQTVSNVHDDDVGKLKYDLDKKISEATETALTSISEHRSTYKSIIEKLVEESFAAQIGKQRMGFPEKICLGSILHPIMNYRRDLVSNALSCGDENELEVLFEMPLVGRFDNYDNANAVAAPTKKKNLFELFDFLDDSEADSDDDSEEKDIDPKSLTNYKVVLEEIGPSEVVVISFICKVAEISFDEAKKLIQSLPSTIKDKVTKSDGEEIANNFRKIGAKAVVKGRGLFDDFNFDF